MPVYSGDADKMRDEQRRDWSGPRPAFGLLRFSLEDPFLRRPSFQSTLKKKF